MWVLVRSFEANYLINSAPRAIYSFRWDGRELSAVFDKISEISLDYIPDLEKYSDRSMEKYIESIISNFRDDETLSHKMETSNNIREFVKFPRN